MGFKCIDTVEKALIAFNAAEYMTERKTGSVITDEQSTFTGDIMCHSYQYNEAYDSATGTYDFSHNFTDMKKYFDNADLVIGNLETVFAGENVGISDYPCFNSPDSFADAIKDAGFDVLTTANNHSMDKRMAGVLRTLDVLDERGIDHMGTYRSAEERDNILIKDVNGIKIAFLSYTYGTNGIPIPEGKEYAISLIDKDKLAQDMAALRPQCDYLVISLHWGTEYLLEPTQEQQELGPVRSRPGGRPDSGAPSPCAGKRPVAHPGRWRTDLLHLLSGQFRLLPEHQGDHAGGYAQPHRSPPHRRHGGNPGSGSSAHHHPF